VSLRVHAMPFARLAYLDHSIRILLLRECGSTHNIF
jgi:hypothetical protein